MPSDLAYTGKIIKIEDIPGADRIKLCTAVCGQGGIWRGVVPNNDAVLDNRVVVFQPDSLLPPDNPVFAFMDKYGWRVKQQKFREMPSESLILPQNLFDLPDPIGSDVTERLGIRKYEKPGFKGNWQSSGLFPPFLIKTDEPNFQKVPEMVERMRSMPVRVTLKMDGMSTTAFHTIVNGEHIYGVCSRNMLITEGDNPFWTVAKKYDLPYSLPEYTAIQWETCGPAIQKNPIGLSAVDGFAFNMWDISTRHYIHLNPHIMPTVPVIEELDPNEQPADWQEYAQRFAYPNDKPAEGIVIRPRVETFEHVDLKFQRFSFKVINLLYKD